MKLKEHQTGLVLGAMMALMHALWATMVWLGVAQSYTDWILNLHSIAANPFTVLSFDLVRSLTLIVVTFVVGYLMGWVFANIWNKIVKK